LYANNYVVENLSLLQTTTQRYVKIWSIGLSLWLIGTVRAEPETVISRAWVQSPDPAE